MTIISCKNLNIYYGKKKIIDDFSIDFEDKKITALIGPSGCGKTTLLVSLNKILQNRKGSYDGEILYLGKDIETYDINQLRTQIGMVFQEPTPFPLSIRENVEIALKYHGLEYKKKAIEAIKKVGLYDEVKDDLNKKASALSGGQQQRLSIARSIAINPRVLLLDEPCSSLDVMNIEKIEDLLEKLKEEMAIIIVTHNLQQAKRISDKTAFMLNGKLVEYGDSGEIFSNPKDPKTQAYVSGLFG